jgi:hypothetical protein
MRMASSESAAVQVGHHVGLDGVRSLAAGGVVGQGGEGGNAPGRALLGVAVQGGLQGVVGDRFTDALA